jgi:hypothetical protein
MPASIRFKYQLGAASDDLIRPRGFATTAIIETAKAGCNFVAAKTGARVLK